ncbi:VF1 [Norovirus GV]|nr:VF1 [Norovirus GV]
MLSIAATPPTPKVPRQAKAQILFLPPLIRPSPFNPWQVRQLLPPPRDKSTKLTLGSEKILSSVPLESSLFPQETHQVRFCLIWLLDPGSTPIFHTSLPCIQGGLGIWKSNSSSQVMPLLLARWLLPLFHHTSTCRHSQRPRSRASRISCVMCELWNQFCSLFWMSGAPSGTPPTQRMTQCVWYACSTPHLGLIHLVMRALWCLGGFCPDPLWISTSCTLLHQ